MHQSDTSVGIYTVGKEVTNTHNCLSSCYSITNLSFYFQADVSVTSFVVHHYRLTFKADFVCLIYCIYFYSEYINDIS